MPNPADRNPETPHGDPLGGDKPAKPGTRTAAAGSEFLKALVSDLAAVVLQLRYTPPGQIQQLAQRRRSTRKSTRPRRAPSTGRSVHRLILGLAVVGIASMLVVSAALLWALLGLPIDRRQGGPNQPTLLLEAADGEALGRVGLLRMPDATLPEFGPLLVKAVLSTEDRRFYSHPGLDLLGILHAARANKIAREVVEGGSAITQQLVKLEYLNDDRS